MTENRATEIKKKLIKVSKSRKRNGRCNKYHKLLQECVADQHTNGDKKRIRIKTGFEPQKYVSQTSIQRDMEGYIQGGIEMDIPK